MAPFALIYSIWIQWKKLYIFLFNFAVFLLIWKYCFQMDINLDVVSKIGKDKNSAAQCDEQLKNSFQDREFARWKNMAPYVFPAQATECVCCVGSNFQRSLTGCSEARGGVRECWPSGRCLQNTATQNQTIFHKNSLGLPTIFLKQQINDFFWTRSHKWNYD